jgi:tetratricopeptide (TPR) repeat protein
VVAQINVGRVLHELGQFADALDSFKKAFVIAERLAKSDPQNAEWQRGVSVIHERIGDTLAAQSNHGEALESFQAALAIRQTLARLDPANVSWQGDLALGHERVGSAYANLKQNDQAEVAYERALAIYAALLERSPDNAGLLFGSAMPLMRLGMLHGANGVPYLEKALAILKQLDATGRLDPRRRSMIAVVEGFVKGLRARPAPP